LTITFSVVEENAIKDRLIESVAAICFLGDHKHSA